MGEATLWCDWTVCLAVVRPADEATAVRENAETGGLAEGGVDRSTVGPVMVWRSAGEPPLFTAETGPGEVGMARLRWVVLEPTGD